LHYTKHPDHEENPQLHKQTHLTGQAKKKTRCRIPDERYQFVKSEALNTKPETNQNFKYQMLKTSLSPQSAFQNQKCDGLLALNSYNPQLSTPPLQFYKRR
jgi:hypothetical protein